VDLAPDESSLITSLGYLTVSKRTRTAPRAILANHPEMEAAGDVAMANLFALGNSWWRRVRDFLRRDEFGGWFPS
jgi:hypothetical protein